MKKISVLLCLLLSFAAKGQNYYWNTDSVRREEPNYIMDKYHDLLRFHDPIMYLAYPYVKSATGRIVPLEEGEGKNGYFLEGNFAYRFVIKQGKYYSAPWIQRMRSTFDVGMTVRLANDFSSPLLPMSARLGVGLDYLLSSLEGLGRDGSTIVWTTLQLHHYSNGQSDSFFTDLPVQRNNYKGGDFSTNYVRGLLNFGFNTKERSAITTSIGYQNEIEIGGPFLMSKELRGHYGLQRLLFGLQWVQKPFYSTTTLRNRGTMDASDQVVVQKRRQIMVRTEFEYILDDLSNWQSSNLQRWGAHAYLTYMPSVTNEVGFMAHAYYGRDYLNIRFDDVVYIGELGLYVKFNTP